MVSFCPKRSDGRVTYEPGTDDGHRHAATTNSYPTARDPSALLYEYIYEKRSADDGTNDSHVRTTTKRIAPHSRRKTYNTPITITDRSIFFPDVGTTKRLGDDCCSGRLPSNECYEWVQWICDKNVLSRYFDDDDATSANDYHFVFSFSFSR